MTIYNDVRTPQSIEGPSYSMSRHNKNQKSLVAFKPTED